MTSDGLPEDTAQLHTEAYVLDLHGHAPGFVPQPFRTAWHALTPGAPPATGLDALGPGTVDAAIVAAVGDPVVTRCYLPHSAEQAVQLQLDQIVRQTAAAGGVVARSVADLAAARRSRQLTVLLGVEGADAIGRSVDRVDAWYERGVRLVTLVHLGDNALGTTCLPWQRYAGPLPVRRPPAIGLSALGGQVVDRMNRLGMLVDVAHADRATVLDVVDRSTAPVVASHTGARALQDFARYLSDDELRAIASTGGVIGLWPYRDRRHGVRDVAELVDHARHVADLVGAEHLALGTDLNGIPGAMAGYRGPADLPEVTRQLLGAGFDRHDVTGILGGNAVRVLEVVEECASSSP